MIKQTKNNANANVKKEYIKVILGLESEIADNLKKRMNNYYY